MAIWDLFSKRQADVKKAGSTDVYQYDDIPENLRVQITQISIEAIGKVGFRSAYYGSSDTDNPRWQDIERIFCREKGVHGLERGDFSGERIVKYMATCGTADWLDLLELMCVMIVLIDEDSQKHSFRHQWEINTTKEAAISEVNYRLKQANVGYQFEDNFLIRVDSQFIHADIVKPALSLLSGKNFSGPNQEFLEAHQHYRKGEYRQAVSLAASALESTFKAIFDKNGWSYSKGARISDLVKVARSNHLWPDYLDSSFDQLIATLQSGLPKIRDNDAAHGQGSVPKHVPSYIASYALHLAASKIVFLVEAAGAA